MRDLICCGYFVFISVSFVLGVLLLNAVLTVEANKANSHKDMVGICFIVMLHVSHENKVCITILTSAPYVHMENGEPLRTCTD